MVNIIIYVIHHFSTFFKNLTEEAYFKTLKLDDTEVSSRKCFKMLKISGLVSPEASRGIKL